MKRRCSKSNCHFWSSELSCLYVHSLGNRNRLTELHEVCSTFQVWRVRQQQLNHLRVLAVYSCAPENGDMEDWDTLTGKWRHGGLGSETKESDRSLRVALRLSQNFCKNFRLWIETVLENSAAIQVKNFELASDAKVKIRILVGSYVQWTASSCSHCEVHTCLLLD